MIHFPLSLSPELISDTICLSLLPVEVASKEVQRGILQTVAAREELHVCGGRGRMSASSGSFDGESVSKLFARGSFGGELITELYTLVPECCDTGHFPHFAGADVWAEN